MAFNPLDPQRDKHFQMLLDYMIQQFGRELGIQHYNEWLEKYGYDDTEPMIKQRGLKSLSNALENVTRKTKGKCTDGEKLRYLKEKIAEKITKDALKIAMKKDADPNELWQFRKKVENAREDSKLISKFTELGEDPDPIRPDPQDLKDLKRYYLTATQMSPTSIQAKSAKALFARTVEKMIKEGSGTRKQIEKFL